MRTFIQIISTILLTSCFSINKNGPETFKPVKSQIVTGNQKTLISNLYKRSKFNFDSFSVDLDFLKKELDSYEYYDKTSEKDTNNCLIQVSINRERDTTKTVIELSGTPYYREIQVDISKEFGFISWISIPFYHSQMMEGNPNEQFELHLKIIELGTGAEIFNDIIHTTKCCIDRLSMKFNPFTNSILFAYNDFSQSNSKYLMYGNIGLQGKKVVSTKLEPKGIILQDQWEKTFPKFLINDNSVYLYHSTGDSWTFWEHVGKQQIGISRIDKKNNPTDYKLITDTCAINGEVYLIGDTVFYRTRLETKGEPNRTVIKKASLNDLIKYER